MFMKDNNGKKKWPAMVAALVLCIMCANAAAITPEQYLRSLDENVEGYSGTRKWRSVAGELRADTSYVSDSDERFNILDEEGNAYLETRAARMSISGDVHAGNIECLYVKVSPVGSTTREFEYQAFSLSEIAFKSLISRAAMRSDMSAYLFLYDIYPYALWADDSLFGDSKRSVKTALDGMNYNINASASADDNSISLAIRVSDEATQAEANAALENLYANYALESICSLVYELKVCKNTCVSLFSQDGMSDDLSELMGDMRACAMEYYALDADTFGKLSRLTEKLTPLFERMLTAIDSLSACMSESAVSELEEAVNGMDDALSIMY